MEQLDHLTRRVSVRRRGGPFALALGLSLLMWAAIGSLLFLLLN